jgi:CheY-like chemotaxis protein
MDDISVQKTILIIEHFENDARQIESIIRKNTEMIPLSASSGSLALEMFEVHMFKTKKYHTPELIIMDVLLPSEESFELAKKLSKADNTKEIPVLFIVSSADIGNKKRIYQEGGKVLLKSLLLMRKS